MKNYKKIIEFVVFSFPRYKGEACGVYGYKSGAKKMAKRYFKTMRRRNLRRTSFNKGD